MLTYIFGAILVYCALISAGWAIEKLVTRL